MHCEQSKAMGLQALAAEPPASHHHCCSTPSSLCRRWGSNPCDVKMRTFAVLRALCTTAIEKLAFFVWAAGAIETSFRACTVSRAKRWVFRLWLLNHLQVITIPAALHHLLVGGGATETCDVKMRA